MTKKMMEHHLFSIFNKDSKNKYSGFDRGHLASDASFDFDEKALRKTYSLANVVPQYPTLNRNIWLKAEKYERAEALRLKSVNVLNLSEYSNKTIGDGLHIPTKFYKILWDNNSEYKKCFAFDNVENQAVKDLKYYEINCKAVALKIGAGYD